MASPELRVQQRKPQGHLIRHNKSARFQVMERYSVRWQMIQEIFRMLDALTYEVVYVSPEFEQICDRSCQSLYEAPTSYREIIHPDHRADVLGFTLWFRLIIERSRRVRPYLGLFLCGE